MITQIAYGNDIFSLLSFICIIVPIIRKTIFNFFLTYFNFIIDFIHNKRYSVIFCNIVRHVQIVIRLLLSKEIAKYFMLKKEIPYRNDKILSNDVLLYKCNRYITCPEYTVTHPLFF